MRTHLYEWTYLNNFGWRWRERSRGIRHKWALRRGGACRTWGYARVGVMSWKHKSQTSLCGWTIQELNGAVQFQLITNRHDELAIAQSVIYIKLARVLRRKMAFQIFKAHGSPHFDAKLFAAIFGLYAQGISLCWSALCGWFFWYHHFHKALADDGVQLCFGGFLILLTHTLQMLSASRWRGTARHSAKHAAKLGPGLLISWPFLRPTPTTHFRGRQYCKRTPFSASQQSTTPCMQPTWRVCWVRRIAWRT